MQMYKIGVLLEKQRFDRAIVLDHQKAIALRLTGTKSVDMATETGRTDAKDSDVRFPGTSVKRSSVEYWERRVVWPEPPEGYRCYD